ncbi:MAG: GTP-binding protein [Alphaproteobacteria bacterium]|nr:GTP-binding protein [Alphaproteobacteria bacterium]
MRGRPLVPVSLLTGFLGSGKTTVLNRLLRQPGLGRIAIVINEFGEIGLDHELVESSSEDMILLRSGCLCCTIRGDLVDTLQRLVRRRDDGEIAFDRVVIETTGLADPAPILHTLMQDPVLIAVYRLDGVITTVDAANGNATLDCQIEAVKQAAVADRILLTKTDLVSPDRSTALVERLGRLNPAAPIVVVRDGNVDPASILDAGLYDPATKSLNVQRWLQVEAYTAGRHRDHHHHGHDVNRHDAHIKATCLTFDTPLDGAAFDTWLGVLLMLKGRDMLRIKGIVNVAGLDGPLIIHGVQHVFHPPVRLKRWPGGDRRTRIVFITRDIDEAALRDTLAVFWREPARPSAAAS